jgi:hypothetical protein
MSWTQSNGKIRKFESLWKVLISSIIAHLLFWHFFIWAKWSELQRVCQDLWRTQFAWNSYTAVHKYKYTYTLVPWILAPMPEIEKIVAHSFWNFFIQPNWASYIIFVKTSSKHTLLGTAYGCTPVHLYTWTMNPGASRASVEVWRVNWFWPMRAQAI